MDMRRALKDRLVNYKIPQEMKVVDGQLPRNAMGKSTFSLSSELIAICLIRRFSMLTLILTVLVNKKALVKEIYGDPTSSS